MCHIGPPTTSSSRSETRDLIDNPLYEEGLSRTDHVCGVGWNRRIGPDNYQLDTLDVQSIDLPIVPELDKLSLVGETPDW